DGARPAGGGTRRAARAPRRLLQPLERRHRAGPAPEPRRRRGRSRAAGARTPAGLALPPGARRLTVRASVKGDPVTLRLAFLTPRGTYEIAQAGAVGRSPRDAILETPPAA